MTFVYARFTAEVQAFVCSIDLVWGWLGLFVVEN